MIPNNSLIVSPTEPTGKNRKKVWMQKGKNLFDKLFRQGTHISTTVTTHITNENEIATKKGKSYTFSTNLPSTYLWKLMNDNTNNISDVIVIDDTNYSSSDITINCSNNGFLKILIKKSDGSNISINEIQNYDFMIEQNPTATEHEDYIEPKIYIKNSNDVYEEFTKAFNGYYGCEYKEYSRINLDNMIVSGSGMFVCKDGCTNTPTYSGVRNMHWFVIQITAFTNYAVQIATGVHTNTDLYIRHCINNSWRNWVKISSTTI